MFQIINGWHINQFFWEKYPNLLVEDLIHDATGQWDRDKVFDLFAHKTRMEILQMPLSRLSSRDKLVWKENRSQSFFVKTAYQVGTQYVLAIIQLGIFWGSLTRMVRGPICGSAAMFGREFGSFISQPRLKYLCGELATTFCQLLKSFGNGRLLRRTCVPYATESLKKFFMLCGSVLQLRTCGSVLQLRTCGLAVLTVCCKKGCLSKSLCFV